MFRIDSAPVKMHIAVITGLGLKELIAAGKHHVGSRDQYLLALSQKWRRKAKLRKLVHAVINSSRRVDTVQKVRCGHGRIEPLNRRFKPRPEQWIFPECATQQR